METNKIKRSKRAEKSVLLFYSLSGKIGVGIILLSIIIFIAYPVLAVLLKSVIIDHQFSLELYKTLLSAKNISLIRNSFFIAIVSSIIATVFSFLIALNVYVSSKKEAQIIKKSLLITMISPPFVTALALIKLFGRRGVITYGLLGLTINPYGVQGIILLQVIGNMSLATLMLIDSFEQMDNRLVLASYDLGVSTGRTFFHIVLPHVLPGILSVLFILFTINLADFTTPIIIGGNYKVLATEAYKLIFSTGNLNEGSTLSVLMLLPAILAFVFYSRFMKQSKKTGDVGKQTDNKQKYFRVSMFSKIVIKLITIIFFILMFLKFFNIFLTAFANTSTGKVQFTMQYWKLLRTDLVEAFIRTIVYAVIAGACSSLIGVLFSYINFKNDNRYAIFDFVTSLPYIIPGTFFGLGYLIAFKNPPIALTGTAAIIVLNLAFRQLSVATKLGNALFPSIDPRMEMAAKDMGASPFTTLRTVVLPSVRPAIITSFVQTFTASMTSVGAIIFLISPGKNVISIEMFKAISGGGYELGAIIALLILIATVSVNCLAIFLMKGE